MSYGLGPQTFVATDSKDNALGTAAAAAVTGRHQVITKIVASYSTLATPGLLTVKKATSTIFTAHVHGRIILDFPDGLWSDAGAAISAELTASGTGSNIGVVTIVGRTV